MKFLQLLLAFFISTKAQECSVTIDNSHFDLTPHIDFGTMGPIVDSSSIFSTYLSVCHDGTQTCQLTPEMALRYQTSTYCSSVVGRWVEPEWSILRDDDGREIGVQQNFENGDLCFGQVSTEPSKTTINFICDRDAVGDTYTTTSDNFQCDWTFHVRTPFACSGSSDCGSCIMPRDEPGCSDEWVEECVCRDIGASACCSNSWSPHCVDVALNACNCELPLNCGNCMIPHGGPSCENEEVSECVCQFAPFCCTNTWEQPCVDISKAQCGCFDCGNCNTPHEGSGCDDTKAEECVCNIAPSCCTDEWNGVCADLAIHQCACPVPQRMKKINANYTA